MTCLGTVQKLSKNFLKSVATIKSYCLQPQIQAVKFGLHFFFFTDLVIVLYYNTFHCIKEWNKY